MWVPPNTTTKTHQPAAASTKTPTKHAETVSVGQICGTHHRDGEVATTDFRRTAVLGRVVATSVRTGKTIGGRGVFAIVAGVPRFTQTSPGIAIAPFPRMASVVVPTAFKRIETFPPTVGCLLLFGRQRQVAHGPGQLPCVFVLGPGIGRLHDSLLQQSGCRRCGGGGGKGEGWRGGRGGGWGAVRVAEQCQGEEEGQGGWWHCGSISGGTGLATIIVRLQRC